MSGVVWGLGLGPGDPELLTLKAARLLAELPVIAYPANPAGDSLALSIAEGHLRPETIRLPLVMDFAPDRGSALAAYTEGAEAIGAHLLAGRDVGVLCLGDPLLYGSFAYLLEALPNGSEVQVVPGITSFAAAAAAATWPLALGNEPFQVLPATAPEPVLAEALIQSSGLAILKLGRNFNKIVQLLAKYNMIGRTLYVERVGWPDQRIAPLAEIVADAEAVAPYFALLLVEAGE